jgi:hypothetical protein
VRFRRRGLLLACSSSPGSIMNHGLLLRYCEVRTAEFAPIVDDALAFELYKLHKSRVRTIHRPWNRTHRPASQSSLITFLTCGSRWVSHGLG